MGVIGGSSASLPDVSSFARIMAPNNEPSIESINENDFTMKNDEPSLFDEEAFAQQ
eukprot:CAMPEP_0185576234 /NCGR_PEP_ID=MMETSP0434-20130131/7201_1 /TAXON_ID=626734 ORGANISM="Favella taraikaensis, Strain Fe Narragansett Bay" /NCGR_SAMPLE_ID=MMETSP0434 /ASSEMBLY_ACC=CAM_ASM_000379 /LENGTH=55 /DNA_ID=CAMNT_0028193345 /DNA_START=643 /DNA_END=810 /DNA_ORIENTATION=+